MSEDRGMLERRSADARANPRQVPCGEGRSQAFGAQLRASSVIWNGSERRLLEGYASVVEKRYRMYDMFGEYDEIVDAGAFDKTLSRNPDVAYLVNHRGVTMARTTNGSLELGIDVKGLRTAAYVNPKRSDVNDIVIAIEDKDVDEMSFAFRINEGEWSEDYTEYRILEIDLDRGDVSAVNYGASPHTSVAARQAEVLADLKRLPAGAQRAAAEMLSARVDRSPVETPEAEETVVSPGVIEPDEPVQRTLDEARATLNEPTGRSIDTLRRLLDLTN